jgi:hypothetical protein
MSRRSWEHADATICGAVTTRGMDRFEKKCAVGLTAGRVPTDSYEIWRCLHGKRRIPCVCQTVFDGR